LVSTISFSGVARMDYSLLGNNVLKDHSQPALTITCTPRTKSFISQISIVGLSRSVYSSRSWGS